jgi:hypothetical protein
MPRVSIRQQLLRGAYKYAEKLQKWRRRDREQAMRHAEEEEEITAGLGIRDDLYTQNADEPLEDESDGSSISSISAISSLSSINTDSDSGEFTLDIPSDILLDTDCDIEGVEVVYARGEKRLVFFEDRFLIAMKNGPKKGIKKR